MVIRKATNRVFGQLLPVFLLVNRKCRDNGRLLVPKKLSDRESNTVLQEIRRLFRVQSLIIV